MELLLGLLILGGIWTVTRSSSSTPAPAPTPTPAPRALPARVLTSTPIVTPEPEEPEEPAPAPAEEPAPVAEEPEPAPSTVQVTPIANLRATFLSATSATALNATASPKPTAPAAPATPSAPSTPSTPTPAAPAAPLTPSPSEKDDLDETTIAALIAHNANAVNAYRATKGIASLVVDSALSSFALEASMQLARDNAPHGYYKKNAPILMASSAENQGDPSGRPSGGDLLTGGIATIDSSLAMMFAEGPSKDFGKGAAGKGIPMGNHYDHMMDPNFKRIGVGIYHEGGRFYLTNDFVI